MSGEHDKSDGAGLALIGELLRPRRRLVTVALIATIISTVATLVPPFLAGEVINNVIVTGSSRDLVLIAVALVVSLAVAWVADVVDTRATGEVGIRALMELRERIAAKLHRLPMSHYDRESTGRMISRLTNDVESLNRLVSGGLNELASSLLVMIGTILVMVALDWRLAVVSLFVFPLLTTLSILIERRARPAWAEASQAIGTVTAYAQEGLAGRDVVRGFGQEQRHVDGFASVSGDSEQAHVTPLMTGRLFGPSASIVTVLATGAILVFGATQVDGGVIEVGTVVTFTAYLRQALAPLPRLAGLFSALQQGLTALQQIGELMDVPEDEGQLAGRKRVNGLAGSISLDHVTFAYSEDKWVLHDVDLEIEPGESVAFVGESGCGKSTIVKLMMGFYAPQRGRVLLDGVDLQSLDLASVRSRIGFVPQEAFLFEGTVAENVVWGRDARSDAARDAASAVGLLDVLEALPDGLETRIGEGGAGLSAGQRQLIALARAVFGDPRVMILDEATSNIDVATEARLQRGIERLMKGRTSIAIAHRLSTIRQADRIVVIHDGRVVEIGSPAELREAGGRYARLESEYEAQQPDA